MEPPCGASAVEVEVSVERQEVSPAAMTLQQHRAEPVSRPQRDQAEPVKHRGFEGGCHPPRQNRWFQERVGGRAALPGTVALCKGNITTRDHVARYYTTVLLTYLPHGLLNETYQYVTVPTAQTRTRLHTLLRARNYLGAVHN